MIFTDHHGSFRTKRPSRINNCMIISDHHGPFRTKRPLRINNCLIITDYTSPFRMNPRHNSSEIIRLGHIRNHPTYTSWIHPR
ncbi:hypothetical protein Hanom_Chr16g01497341 [Helianthus anomalus]